MTPAEALLIFAGGVAEAPAAGPSGAPTGLTVETYAVGVPTDPPGIRVRWTNTDLSAYTNVYLEAGGCGGTASLQSPIANPGATVVDLGQLRSPGAPAEQAGFVAKHYKNGQESAGSNCVAVNIGGSTL